jgi:hypothetical protein
LSPFTGSRDPSGSRGEGNSEAGSAGWTSKLPGEADGESALDVDADGDTYEHRGTAETLRGIIDPLEIAAAKALTGAPTSESSTSTTSTAVGVDSGGTGDPDAALLNGPISLTSERYKQRTEVFNSLLRFVSESEKEPVGDLLDLVNQGGMDEIVDLGVLERGLRAA